LRSQTGRGPISAAIRHIHYKPQSEELSIWSAPQGRRYTYFSVPEAIYASLRDADSRGRFFNQSIRGRYECRLVDPSEQRTRRWQALRSAS
jgi:hypothetical protein